MQVHTGKITLVSLCINYMINDYFGCTIFENKLILDGLYLSSQQVSLFLAVSHDLKIMTDKI